MIPAIIGAIAMVAGAAMQYQSQQSAAKRAASESLAAMRRQQAYQREAEQTALDRAQDYKTENRQEEQQAITDNMEHEYLAPTMSAQSINANAATTQGNVSGDYSAAKAKSDMNVENLAKTFANLMAKTNSAKQLRLNEGYKNADAASMIGRLQNFSQGQSAVDQMKIQDAANSGSTGRFLGDVLQSIGSYGMLSGAGSAAKAPASLDSFIGNYSSGFGSDFSKNFFDSARGMLR